MHLVVCSPGSAVHLFSAQWWHFSTDYIFKMAAAVSSAVSNNGGAVVLTSFILLCCLQTVTGREKFCFVFFFFFTFMRVLITHVYCSPACNYVCVCVCVWNYARRCKVGLLFIQRDGEKQKRKFPKWKFYFVFRSSGYLWFIRGNEKNRYFGSILFRMPGKPRKVRKGVTVLQANQV